MPAAAGQLSVRTMASCYSCCTHSLPGPYSTSRTCFLLLLQITFEEDLKITEMISGEGEKVPFTERLYPEGNVEDWLLEVERVMRESLRKILSDSLEDYTKVCLIIFIHHRHGSNDKKRQQGNT